MLLIKHNPNLKKKPKAGFQTSLINNKKYYICGKVSHFIKNYQSNMVRKDKTLIIIIKQFNIIIKEYPIKILNKEFKP